MMKVITASLICEQTWGVNFVYIQVARQQMKSFLKSWNMQLPSKKVKRTRFRTETCLKAHLKTDMKNDVIEVKLLKP